MNCIYTTDVPCMKTCKDCYLCEEHKDENYNVQLIQYRRYFHQTVQNGIDTHYISKGIEKKKETILTLFDFIALHKQIFILDKERFKRFYDTAINKLNDLATDSAFGEQLATEYKNKLNLDNIIEEEIEPITYNIDDIVIEIVI